MPVTVLDLIVIGVVLISALLASLRGFTREVLAIASWGAALVAALLLYKQVLPYVTPHIANATAAIAVAAASVFLVTLVVAYFLTARLSDMILDSRIGALDRTLGFLFGAARGFLLAVIGFGFFNWLVADKQKPAWVLEAKTKPILERTEASLRSYFPDDPEALLNNLRRPKGEGGTDAPADAAPPAGGTPTPVPTPQRRTDNAPADSKRLQTLIEGATSAPKPAPR